MSSLPLYSGSLYNKETHCIAEGGPLDLRLGVGNKSHICGTCARKLVDCPGHFGHFSLALPIFHVGYFKYVVNILQCICKVFNNN